MSDTHDKLTTRVANVEEGIRILMQLALRTDGRKDALIEAQTNSERKIAALADAQIRTEAAMTSVHEALARLTDSQRHTDQRLDALIDIVRRKFEDTPPAA